MHSPQSCLFALSSLRQLRRTLLPESRDGPNPQAADTLHAAVEQGSFAPDSCTPKRGAPAVSPHTKKIYESETPARND